ncbi:DUF4864 domain-containing protein [Hypericibacter terrae]|uniref:DUF4864 domain-containing protein n=1 Tax=Hypericibacter terrae TaxID=2602015 RepID=A0A5J6MKJ1_9PROT|nr:DUF4864 domain-containing protein [Hypericibacter terrae]QEX15256.1 DUF4864 domain-containing protein [Hypericibacter terrae]
MRVLLTALVLGWVLSAPLAARAGDESLAPADANAIHQVIERQIDAFRHDDGATAFGFASPAIQQKFGDPGNFMAMVKTGYPQVYRPKSVEFEDLSVEDVGPVQNVRVVGPDGIPVLMIYLMQKQPDGSWRINGVYMTQAPDQSV